MKEYKVLTEKDSRFKGRFTAENMETALNSYAAEGWQAVSLSRDSWASMKVRVMIILERDHT
jgi:uncharacterized protein YegP (UPF0339 family)